jgi:hypothetical protein
MTVVGTVAAVVEIKITPQTQKRAVSDIVRTQFGTALSCFPAPEYKRGLILKSAQNHLAEYDSYGSHESLPESAAD